MLARNLIWYCYRKSYIAHTTYRLVSYLLADNYKLICRLRRFPKSAVGLANEKTEVSAKYNNQHYVHMNVAVSTLTILGTGHYLSPGGEEGGGV